MSGIADWTLARIPSHGIAPSLMALSPFVFRLPHSQRHTGFWLLKLVRFCQGPPRYPPAPSRAPSRPASSWACPIYEAIVWGCWGNAGSGPHSEPTDFWPFPRSLDPAAASVCCLGGSLGGNPLMWVFARPLSPPELWGFPSSTSRRSSSCLCRVE